jgi:hypothetical protein
MASTRSAMTNRLTIPSRQPIDLPGPPGAMRDATIVAPRSSTWRERPAVIDEQYWHERGRAAYDADARAGLLSPVSADAAKGAVVFMYFDELGALPTDDAECALAWAIGGYLEAHRERPP